MQLSAAATKRDEAFDFARICLFPYLPALSLPGQEMDDDLDLYGDIAQGGAGAEGAAQGGMAYEEQQKVRGRFQELLSAADAARRAFWMSLCSQRPSPGKARSQQQLMTTGGSNATRDPSPAFPKHGLSLAAGGAVSGRSSSRRRQGPTGPAGRPAAEAGTGR